MTIQPSDVNLIARRAKPAVLRVSEEARKELRRLTGEAAKNGTLGNGRFHLQITEQFVAEHRGSAGAIWHAIKDVLETPTSVLTAEDAEPLKKLLLDGVTAVWRQLEVDLENALKTHGGLGGHASRLGDAHQLLIDELYAEVDLYLRKKLAEPVVARGASEPLDELTKLPTRKALASALTNAFCVAPSVDQPVSLGMVDVDKFKSVNDTHGHQKGDEVLAEVAARISASVLHKGAAYRYGGEEFLVLLPNSDTVEASVIAERIRMSVESRPLAGLTMTVSIGIATAPFHAGTADELIRLADSALYDAKNRGRNLVRMHGDPEPTVEKKQPVRRQPVPGGWTPEEAEQIRRDYFTTRVARCPKDDALLMVKKLQARGQATPMLFVRCELCGTHEQI